MGSYDDILARQQQQSDFLGNLREQREESLKSFVETQVVVGGIWVAMSLREQQLRRRLGPAGYERHSIMVTAALGAALVIAAVVFLLAGVTGFNGAVLSVCATVAAVSGLPGLYLIRAARLRHIRLIRGIYGN